MPRNLVIVESPAKAKTIEQYLGSDYRVVSSFGHIRDLPDRTLGVDVENGFLPQYTVSAEKKDVVSKLKKEAAAAETVWLASDEDREGEAISWHLAEVLGLNPATTKRIVFHEITKNAILKAIDAPRTIDMNLVNAQQARRVLDRLVGFEMSPVLWKKVRRGLSAGRVQSVAVRLIVEREREINAFSTQSDFRTVGQFQTPEGARLSAELQHRFTTADEAKPFLALADQASYTVQAVETKPAKRTPAAPFTTSTLQQEASRKLGYSVSRTMQLAQRLYESGFITYMRTDSVNLSQDALGALEAAIHAQYGEKYHKRRTFATKSKGAQEAHEAIRPTRMDVQSAGEDAAQKRLYELIWKRTTASQMADAALERTTAELVGSQLPYSFRAEGEVLLFDGFLKVYREGHDDDHAEEASDLLPPLTRGQSIHGVSFTATERFSRPPARYSEAALVKKLEELGIGRPSTYAPTISTILKREYVKKGELEGTERNYLVLHAESGSITQKTATEKTGSEKGKLLPTDTGTVVTDFLQANFSSIMDYAFTARMESEFDLIAEGRADWQSVITDFHKDFSGWLRESANAERASGERILGIHPSNGLEVSARVARFGPIVQIAAASEEEKPKYASIPSTQSLETITLEQALKLFDLPRTVGEFEGLVLKANTGRFGPYVQHGKEFVSLPKELSPLDVTEEQAIELVLAKRNKAAADLLQALETALGRVEVRNGRYGPYLKLEKENFKIPKGTDPMTLDASAVESMIADQRAQPSKGRVGARAKRK